MIGSIASLVPQVAQANAQADDAAVLAQYHFLQQLRLNAEQHEMKLRAKATMFKESASLDRQLHLRTMAHELNIARREGVRDVWKARNDTAQTLMIVESVFLAFVFEIIVGARIPDDTPEVVLYLFSGLLGCAVTTSMVGIILLLVQHHRLAQFDFTSTGPCDTCDRCHPDLNDFFDYHCRAVDNLGRAFFAAAVSFSLLTSCVYGTSKWMSHFDGDVVPGIVFCVPLAATILFVWFSSILVPEETVAAEEIQPPDAAVSFRRPIPQPHHRAGHHQPDEPRPGEGQRAASVSSGGDETPTAAATTPVPSVQLQQRSRTNSTFTEGSSASSHQQRRDYGGLRSEADDFHRLLAGSFRAAPPHLGRHSSMPVVPEAASIANSRSGGGGSGTFPDIPEWRLDGSGSDGGGGSSRSSGGGSPAEDSARATPARAPTVPALRVEAPSRPASIAPNSNREEAADDGTDAVPGGHSSYGSQPSQAAHVEHHHRVAFSAEPSLVNRGGPAPLHHHQQHHLSGSGNFAFPVHDDDIDRALMDMDTIDVSVWDDGAAELLPAMRPAPEHHHQPHHHQDPSWSGYDAMSHEMQLMSGPPSRMRSPTHSADASPTRRAAAAAPPVTTYLQAPTPQVRRRRSTSTIERRTPTEDARRSTTPTGESTPPPPSPLVPASSALAAAPLALRPAGQSRATFHRTPSAHSVGGDTSADDGFYTPRSYDADDDAGHAPF